MKPSRWISIAALLAGLAFVGFYFLPSAAHVRQDAVDSVNRSESRAAASLDLPAPTLANISRYLNESCAYQSLYYFWQQTNDSKSDEQHKLVHLNEVEKPIPRDRQPLVSSIDRYKDGFIQTRDVMTFMIDGKIKLKVSTHPTPGLNAGEHTEIYDIDKRISHGPARRRISVSVPRYSPAKAIRSTSSMCCTYSIRMFSKTRAGISGSSLRLS